MTDSQHALDVAAVCTIGLVRPLNEDCISVGRQIIPHERLWRADPIAEPVLLLVADGMGGHAQGEVASRLAVEFLSEKATRMAEREDAIHALRCANNHVFDATLKSPDRAGMGATLVGAQITASRLIWFNVGDSRAYRWRSGQLSQLSIDHVEGGESDALRPSHVVTQSLGGSSLRQEIYPAAGVDEWRRGDWLILCSDGLTDTVSDEMIARTLSRSDDAGCAVLALLERTLQRGAPDNVSVLVAAAR